LRDVAGTQFNVQPLEQRWSMAWPDERRRLLIRGREHAWLREVLLCQANEPLVYARSVIPAATLRGPLQRLRRLGATPLGTLLFGRYRIIRGPIGVAWLNADARLAQRAAQAAGLSAGRMWARRSVFAIAGRELLVTEVFLPSLIRELNDGNASR
jgi:chorismate--pyruvate lyase